MIFDQMIADMKRQKGIEAVAEPVLIDERKHRRLTYRFELQMETWHGLPAIRFMLTEYQGTGRSGKSRKAFTWPVQQSPTEDLIQICDTLLAALEPHAEKIDSRSWLGRTFDNLTGLTYLNEIPVLAEDTTQSKRHWLNAKITEDKQQGQVITIYDEYEKRSPLGMRLPVESIRVLRQKLETGISD